MPRKAPAKTITLLLPSPSSTLPSTFAKTEDTSTPGPSTQPNDSIPDATNLQVLLLAQKLAREKGQTFDIESFLTPSQRTEYYTKILHKPAPSTYQASKTDAGPSTPDKSAKRGIEDGESTPATPTPIDTPGTEDGTPGTAKKRKLPDLSHLHWKQRAKKLAEFARLEAEGLDPMEALTPVEKDPILAIPLKKGEVNRAEIQSKASHWNSLLIEARKMRGPQWDYHSQTYHVDRFSDLYYNHGQDPPASPKHENIKEEKQEDDPKLGQMSASNPTLPPNSSSTLETQPMGRNSPDPLNPPNRPRQIQPPPGMSYSPSPISTHPGNLPPQQSYAPQPPTQPSHLPQQSNPHTMPQFAQQAQQPHQQQQQQQQPQTARMAGPGQMNGFQFTPQQLAHIQQMSAAGGNQPGSLNPAMLSMAAAARNGQPLPTGVNPAALANFASMQNFRPPPTFQPNQGQQQQQGVNLAALGGMQMPAGGNQFRPNYPPSTGSQIGTGNQWQS